MLYLLFVFFGGFFFPNIENINGSLFKMLLELGCGSCFIDSFDQV